MYGYNHSEEYERLKTAAQEGAKLLDEIRPEKMTSGFSLDAWKVLRLMTKICRIRKLVPNDGSWQQRPIDMLARSHPDIIKTKENEPENPSDEAKKVFNKAEHRLALDKCIQWEQTQQLFDFETAFRRAIKDAGKSKSSAASKKNAGQENQDNQSLTEPQVVSCAKEAWKDFCKALQNLEKQQKSNRLSYDIFDNSISYTERIARWQEDTVWALPGLSENAAVQNIVCIPDMYSTYADNIRNLRDLDAFISFSLFCAMLYRHLKGIGVETKDLKLAENEKYAANYWFIPAKSAFGSYQNRVLPDSFFDQVKSCLEKMNNPPVRLISINSRWLAWMNQDLFNKFEAAEKEEAQPQSATSPQPVSPLQSAENGGNNGNNWLQAYQDAEKDEKNLKDFSSWLKAYEAEQESEYCNIPKVDEKKITDREENYFAVCDQGGYDTSIAISQHIHSIYEQKSEKEIAASPYGWTSLFKKMGSQLPSPQAWYLAKKETRIAWLNEAKEKLENDPIIESLLRGKKIALITNDSKNCDFRAAALMVGLYCFANGCQNIVPLNLASSDTSKFETLGEKNFEEYCRNIDSRNYYLFIVRNNDKKLSYAALLTKEESSQIRAILSASPLSGKLDHYNALYQKAYDLLTYADKLDGKCDADHLPTWKDENSLDGLQAFVLRVRFWREVRASQDSDNPFSTESDLEDFQLVNSLLKKKRIKQRLVVRKNQPNLQKIHTKFTETEESLISALKGEKPYPEFNKEQRVAWQNLIRLGMLVLWNMGFPKDTKDSKECTFNYKAPLANSTTGDGLALRFVMFAIDYFKKMEAKTLNCTFENNIWKFGDTKLQISKDTWSAFWENAAKLHKKEKSGSYSFKVTEIQDKKMRDKGFTLSIQRK